MSSSILKVQASALQFGDSREQQRHDVLKIFGMGTDYPIKTGTEAGPETHYHNFIRYTGKEFNHAVHMVRGNWIAIDREIMKRGSLKRGSVFVAKTSEVYGPGHDNMFATVEFDHVDDRIGHVSVAATHYATKGRLKGDPNYEINKRYAKKLTSWVKEAGAGSDIAFIQGDFNMLDSDPKQDWSFGGNWTSMADELKAWKNTGHGPIDGFASYDKDGRVKAKSFDVLNDKEFKLFSDHFIVRGEWEIQHLKSASWTTKK